VRDVQSREEAEKLVGPIATWSEGAAVYFAPGSVQVSIKEYTEMCKRIVELEALLREGMKAWSFSDEQQHTHTWHDRADWVAKVKAALKET
jgi:hypothetical protein